MALKQIRRSAEMDDDARAGVHAMLSQPLRKAFPLPAEEADGRFRELLDALSRRVQADTDQHA